MKLNSIKEAVIDVKAGKMVIVIDNEDRENEGDFIIASEKAKVEDINFMIKEGRGLLCISINNDTANQLHLTPMVSDNTSSHETNFTVSVDAIKNTSTGISAKDRWHTIQTIINEHLNKNGLILLHDYFLDLKPLWKESDIVCTGPFKAVAKLFQEGLD